MGNEQQQPGPSQQQPTVEQPKKKKHTGLIIVLVIIIVLVLGGLVSCYACGTAVDETLEGDTADSVTSDGSSGSGDNSSGDGEAGQDAVTLYEGNDVTVSATERGEELGSAYYTIEIVNDSDVNVEVTIDDLSVDGVMDDYALIMVDVASGKKTEETLDFVDTTSSMDDLVNVEGSIDIVNADSYDTIDSTTFTIK